MYKAPGSAAGKTGGTGSVCNVFDKNKKAYCETFGEKLAWVHYSDSHHLILGDGDFGRERLEGYVRTLERHDYQGCLVLEINDSIYWEDPPYLS